MADTVTPNLGLVKPEPGFSDDTWGGKQNNAFDSIDFVFDPNGVGTPVGVRIGVGKKLAAKEGAVEVTDARFTLFDEGDPTKTLKFDISAFPTGTSGAIVIPGPGAMVTLDGAQTLTNKTLTDPVIAQIENSGLLVLPDGPDTLVSRVSVDTLVNKTLTAPAINSPHMTNVAADIVTADAYTVNGANLVYTTTNHTLVAAENGKTILLASGGPCTLTVPVGLPYAFSCTVVQLGGGQVTIAGSAALFSRIGLKTAGLYAVAGLIGIGTDSYVAGGDLTF